MRLPTFRTPDDRIPVLAEAYPDVMQATPVALGLRTIPVDAIKGTVTPGQARRDRASMLRPAARGRDWAARWRRLEDAARTLAVLPPVDLLQFDDSFWVVDGHNRVALAHAVGQLHIDANVTALRRPGSAAPRERAQLTPLIEEWAPVRAAMAAQGAA